MRVKPVSDGKLPPTRDEILVEADRYEESGAIQLAEVVRFALSTSRYDLAGWWIRYASERGMEEANRLATDGEKEP